MTKAAEASVTVCGDGLTVRFGERFAHCHASMAPEALAEAKAQCEALLLEAATALALEELKASR